MSLRASWKGYLRLSLVSTPVQAVNAVVSGGGKIHFHQLHAPCHNRIRYSKVCPVHGEAPSNEIVSGYEFSKGQYVVIDGEEIDQLRSDADKAINLDTFVEPSAIDPRYFDGRTYYLVPDGPMGLKPYAVLLKALEDRQCFGVGRAIFSGREQLVVVRPLSGVIALEMLHFDAQMLRIDRVMEEIALPEVSKQELRLADKLIEVSSSAKFDISTYVDTYTDRLREVIDAKVAGKEVTGPPREEPAPVINLMDALRKSVAQSQRNQSQRNKSQPTSAKRTPANRPSAKKGIAKTSPSAGRKKSRTARSRQAG